MYKYLILIAKYRTTCSYVVFTTPKKQLSASCVASHKLHKSCHTKYNIHRGQRVDNAAFDWTELVATSFRQ